MAKKRKGTLVWPSTCDGPPSTSINGDERDDTFRKRSYIKAMQSERMTVLVGPTEKCFQMGQDLLFQYSEPLGRMCSSGFIESHERIIRLPEVEVPTFEDFLVWVYAYEPSIDESKSVDALIDLAVFGEIYLIHQLKNQTSDVIRARLGSDKLKLTPDIVSKIYRSVPAGSILRGLCSHGFAIRPRDLDWGNCSASTRKYGQYSEWKTVFEEWAEFGWDYFSILQTVSSEALDISLGGTCRFHDHSDIIGWRPESDIHCPSSCSWSNFASK